ncbi:epoxyqueuosine reductase QueH [Desulfogranum mediterraneum]|uniref:epoxyqueuosine reductase QueH n=1 Tax=Desulfogranum mediterraneum TaxID=160661 RepID=UPI0003FD8B04|nr:epoxyqueuosine reductase QueH [Desulfogranum mediterraneum]
MKLLLHSCCGPCAIYPVARLRQQGHNPTAYFFNPNIHPFREFKKRIAALRQFGEMVDLELEIDTNYGLTDFLRQVVFKESKRCPLCYRMRLEQTARRAAELGMEAFTTTLLYSRYQQHQLIRTQGEQLAERYGLRFHYEDYRPGWQEGIDQSLAMELYRQPYCGCIYSEQERYDKKYRRDPRLTGEDG